MMDRVLVLGLLITGLIVAGLATLKSGLLVLALPLVIYLGAGLIWGPERPTVKASRNLTAERASADEPVTVKISITNEGADLEEVLIEDVIPPSLEVIEGRSRLLTPLTSGETVELEYTLRARRGYYRFLEVRVRASDHLGLFSRQATLAAPGRLFVTPGVLRLKRVEIRPRRTRVYSGLIPARLGGAGVEFFGVRQYQPGDPSRAINWRASARYSELFIIEYEQERVADVGLILDARRRSYTPTKGSPLFERSVEAAAALADALLSGGNRVGLLIYGSHLDWTFPGYGKLQRERILRALARAEPGESTVFEGLEYLPTRLFPARSQLILISPLLEDDLEVLMRLRARGYALLVISPDPISSELRVIKSSEDVELAARIAYLERELLLRRLRQAGVHVLDWQTDIPFHRAVHAALSRSPLWFRALGVGR